MDPKADQLDRIAVIGMAGRFPGASSIEQFAKNLFAGVESVTTFTDDQLLSAGVDPNLVEAPNYVKAGVVLEGIELFDAGFFGYTPREAELTDPQQRVFLECAWEALEDAGYDPDRTRLRVGVFAGAGANSYLENNLLSNPNLVSSLHHLQKSVATQIDHLSTRVSYKLNLKGPSLSIQTACSSSLVATHIACQSLLNGECDMALAGGVSIRVPQMPGYLYEQGSTFSSDGHCRAFDASGQGMMPGSGAAVIVLKRLADAIEDGDFIRAVICASAINNDGAAKVGYTAPSLEGQATVIAAAQALADVNADEISYVEAMGTGTALGDPIEVAALTKAFRRTSQKQGFCAIGSVKTNIGHLGPASGMAGFVKVVLALQHRVLPPSLNFKQPNRSIDFANSPFYVQQKLGPWQPESGRRVAGVSSFAVGGTNAHMIVEEAPADIASGESQPWQLLPISARSPGALEKATDRLAEFLACHGGLKLADVAFTLQQGRKPFPHRRILAAKSVEEAAALLRARDRERVFTGAEEHSGCPVAFVFPKEVGHYVNLGREIYFTEKTFRQHVDLCCEFLKAHMGFDLRQALYPGTDKIADPGDPRRRPGNAETATFVLEYALARLWMSWGVCPEAMIGHGIGEYVAACLAGVFSLEDALKLVAAGAQPMPAVPLHEKKLFEGLQLCAPKIPYLSNLTGAWIQPSEATDPAYWSNHLRQTLRFTDGIGELGELIGAPGRILLEVGWGQTPAGPGQVVLSSFADRFSEAAGMMTTLGQLWTAGLRPDWNALYAGQRRRRVSLPSYPFERQRYWIEGKHSSVRSQRCDSRSLPDQRPTFRAGDLPHDTDLEGILAAVWQEVLGFEKIAGDDNFFNIGGDSFLATLLLSRLRAQLGVELPPNSVFLAPTIAAQAKLIAKTATRGANDIVVQLQKGSPARPPFFMIHSYHLYTSLPGALGSGQPFYGVEEFAVSDPVDNWKLESMMARYVEGIRAVEPHGPYFIGGFCSAAIPALEVARQLEETGESVPLLVIIDPVGTTKVQKSPLERLRSHVESTAAFWRFHFGKVKSMPAAGIVAYARKLAASKLKNFVTNREMWIWRRIIRVYMRCGFRIPNVLRRKLISGIRMVTLEAIRGYSPKPYKGDIAVFVATEMDLELRIDYVKPWRGATLGDVQVIWLPGGHTTAFAEPNLSVFAQKLNDAFDASLRDEGKLGGVVALPGHSTEP